MMVALTTTTKSLLCHTHEGKRTALRSQFTVGSRDQAHASRVAACDHQGRGFLALHWDENQNDTISLVLWNISLKRVIFIKVALV